MNLPLHPRRLQLVLVAFALCAAPPTGAFAATERWTPQQANEWYAKQPWFVGANYKMRIHKRPWRRM